MNRLVVVFGRSIYSEQDERGAAGGDEVVLASCFIRSTFGGLEKTGCEAGQ